MLTSADLKKMKWNYLARKSISPSGKSQIVGVRPGAKISFVHPSAEPRDGQRYLSILVWDQPFSLYDWGKILYLCVTLLCRSFDNAIQVRKKTVNLRLNLMRTTTTITKLWLLCLSSGTFVIVETKMNNSFQRSVIISTISVEW